MERCGRLFQSVPSDFFTLYSNFVKDSAGVQPLASKDGFTIENRKQASGNRNFGPDSINTHMLWKGKFLLPT